MAIKTECRSCMFWAVDDPEQKQGTCRRYPPVPVFAIKNDLSTGGPMPAVIPYFPTMMDFGWCGEWQQRADQ